MISLNHVTKLYGQVIGVNDLSLTLPPGAYGLVGPNGSGKSTLLNLITGQLRPTIGAVTVMDEAPWGNHRMLRRMGVCPEVDMLYHNVTGRAWVEYMLQLYGFSRGESRDRAQTALAQVGLIDAQNRVMGGYSRGMRQRVKLAQAISHEPELLVLDEPLNGLDPIGRHDITTLFRQWIDAGKSLILASHVLHEVEAVTNSFMLICGGRVLASGSAKEVQTLLAELPNEVRIVCDRPRDMAQLVLAGGEAETVRLLEDAKTLIVATRNPAKIHAELPRWLQKTGIRLEELGSTDESLDALFASLLKIHRGQM